MFKNRGLFLGFIFISNFIFSQEINKVSFSHEAGFYNEPFYLKLNVKQGELFYFDENNINNNKKPFPDSLLINKTRTISLLVAHADSIHKLGSFSYFISFNTKFKVVSISIDNDFLFDNHKGIYVKGPRAYLDTSSGFYRNVNWERGWERENFVEIFNEQGERIVSQNSGIKIFGGMTKYSPEKSLRLIARKKYGISRFDANLFNQGKKKYKHFVLRHSGGDYRDLRFLDALLTSLASESGLDVQASSPSHVFVNSEYWGVYNIREMINEHYINNNYSCGTEGVDILQGLKTVDQGSGDEYTKLLKFVQKNNLAISSNYTEVQKMMDTRNFINFWVHQIFYANHDARGNIRWWRSDSLDGRFRWIVYDTDLGFGTGRANRNLLKDFTNPIMTDWYNPNWATFLLRNLLKNDDFKKDFIHQSSFIFSSTLSTKHILRRINEFKNLYDDEMKIHFNERRKFQSYQGNYKNWENRIIKIKQFAEKRDEFSFLHLEGKFNLKKPYYLYLKIENYNHGKVTLNNNELKSELFFGAFYSEYALPISIEPDIGYSYTGYSENTILGKSGDTLKIAVKFIENKSSDIQVVINEINHIDNCFEIYNLEGHQVDLSGWIITDKNNNYYKIDNLLLGKESFAVFHYTDSLHKIDSVAYHKIGFKLSSCDEISLYDNKKQLVDRISYQLIKDQSSYSRNIPFEEFDGIKLEWRSVEESTIGFHNQTYSNLVEEKIKNRRLLTITTVTCSILIIPISLIIRWNKKRKDVMLK